MAFSQEPGVGKIKNIIAIASGKGGVGKSTVTTHLAIALAKSGYRVGLLDADIYGPSQPGMLGAIDGQSTTTDEGSLIPTERMGIRFVSMGLLMGGRDAPVVWRAPMAMKLIHQFILNVMWGELDYLLIDLPPGTGDVQLTLAQQARLTGAVIVTTPQDVALGIAKKGLRMFEQVKVPILGIIENMSGFTCGHCGEVTDIFKSGGAEKMAAELKVPFLGAVPLDTKIMESCDAGVPVFEKYPDAASSKAYLNLSEILILAANKQAPLQEIEPTDVSVNPAGRLEMKWQTGPVSTFEPYALRVECRCASCIDENSGARLLDPKRVPLDIRIKGAAKVGRYAVSIQFSDGHSTGIYPFERLKEYDRQLKAAESFTV